ncbi:MAG: hypothetical protein K0V04_37755 [Deltaproteobacteria bacterium]|nr:hypothetical protein [Deltaproteobacteria bacterium]
MHEVWSRVREGRHVAVVGTPPSSPETLEGEPRWVVVRLSAGKAGPTSGPLDAARRRIAALLGTHEARGVQPLGRLSSRSRLLGEVSAPSPEVALVSAANHLAERFARRSALIIEGLEGADEATVQALAEIIGNSGWLRLPLILSAEADVKEGPLAELLHAVPGEVVRCEPISPPATPFDWSTLGPSQRLVMRAAATMDRQFEVGRVAHLLETDPRDVLLRLQEAADEGAPLVDRGSGRFSISQWAHRELARTVLPSLAEHWHRRLGVWLARGTTAEMESVTDSPADQGRAELDADPAEVPDYDEVLEPAGEDRLRGAADDDGAASASASAGTEGPGTSTTDAVAAESRERADGADADRSDATMVVPPSGSDQTFRLDPEQAARLIGSRGRAAGDPHTQAVEQYLVALRTVASRGDSRRALVIAEQAMALLDRESPSPERDRLRAEVFTMAARVQWRGAGRGAGLTLQGALESLELAEALVSSDTTVDQRAEIAQLIAGVCYDLGDISSLQRAIDALTDAARVLMDAGHSVRAARLLNDQAAVYLRAGDPVRANHLLQQSRDIFDQLHRERPDDPTVIIERAETEHLLARLPLHAQLREGREDDAYSMAMGHARAAAEGYRRLGGRVELGRVTETMGRLETARGRYAQAAEHLDTAIRTAQELGDMTGRARSTASLAELLIASGKASDALAPLRESIAFNVDKGSPLGLAMNRRTLERLQDSLTPASRPSPRLLEAVAKIAARLDEAEGVLGRVSVPGDAD